MIFFYFILSPNYHNHLVIIINNLRKILKFCFRVHSVWSVFFFLLIFPPPSQTNSTQHKYTINKEFLKTLSLSNPARTKIRIKFQNASSKNKLKKKREGKSGHIWMTPSNNFKNKKIKAINQSSKGFSLSYLFSSSSNMMSSTSYT